MTQVQNIAEKQKTFVVKLDKKLEKIIDKQTRQKLAGAYLKLFTGLSWINWTKKYPLGRAWQYALGQCQKILDTKNKVNPAIKYLKNVAQAHKKYWSQVIMTNENSANTLNKTTAETNHIRQYGIKQVRDAMDAINAIIARYNTYIEEQEQDQEQEQEQEQTNTAHQPTAQPQAEQQAAVQKQAQPQAEKQVAPQKQAQPQTEQQVAVQKQTQTQAEKQVATQKQAQTQAEKHAAVQKQTQTQAEKQVAVQKQAQPQAEQQVAVQKQAQPQAKKVTRNSYTTIYVTYYLKANINLNVTNHITRNEYYITQRNKALSQVQPQKQNKALPQAQPQKTLNHIQAQKNVINMIALRQKMQNTTR